MNKILGFLKTIPVLGIKQFQKAYVFGGVVVMMMLITAINPFALDGYADISSMSELENRVATAIANRESTLLIDYSGEDYANMKSWFKTKFDYDVLVSVGGEYAAYNYDGANYTYWSYGDRKRVKVEIRYKESAEESAVVDNWVENFITSNNLRNMSQYDAIKFTHDYLINNIAYVSGMNSTYDVITTNQANCYGYTMLNYKILSKLGIECRTTYGSVKNEHIWNAVKLDGQWYYEDITWDTIGDRYGYFLISTDKLTSTHTIKGNFIVNCPSNYVVSEPIPPEVEEDEVVVPEDNKDEIVENETTNTETPNTNKNEISTEVDSEIVEDDTIVNDSVKDEKVEDTDVKEEVEDSTENNTEDTITGSSPTRPNDSDNNTSIGDSSSSDETSESNKEEVSSPTTNVIQKLIKLLKTLKLFKK